MEAVKALHPDEMSPREALEALYALKAKLPKGEDTVARMKRSDIRGPALNVAPHVAASGGLRPPPGHNFSAPRRLRCPPRRRLDLCTLGTHGPSRCRPRDRRTADARPSPGVLLLTNSPFQRPFSGAKAPR